MQTKDITIEMSKQNAVGNHDNNVMEMTHENLPVPRDNQITGPADYHYYADHEEKHIQVGEYLKSAVYGGTDGLINALAVIVGGLGSNSGDYQIMVVGMSVLIGDGVGMALGDYLSSKSYMQYIKAEEKRELWEVENKLEDEKKEMEELYVEKGYGEAESKRLADLISHNKQAFVNIMMLEELGLAVEEGSPVINGVVTLFAFILCGIFPLMPYLINLASHSPSRDLAISSIVVGAFFLFALGFAKAMLIGTNGWISGLYSLGLGGAAVAIGYAISLGVKID